MPAGVSGRGAMWLGASLVGAMALTAEAGWAAGEGARWGARDPVLTCPQISAQIDSTSAVGLLRCARESITASDELWLLEDVSVQVGAARAFQGRGELMTMPDADTSKPVHSLQGSWTWVTCRDPKAVSRTGGDPGRNCTQARVAKAEGACWMTTFGTWRCNMTGPSASATTGHPPPR